MDAAFTTIANAHKVRDMGELTYFLGIQIVRTASDLTVDQAKYTNKLVSRYHLGKSQHILLCPWKILVTDGPFMDRSKRDPQLMGELQHLRN